MNTELCNGILCDNGLVHRLHTEVMQAVGNPEFERNPSLAKTEVYKGVFAEAINRLAWEVGVKVRDDFNERLR